MGLAAPKQRNRISDDPNNTFWSRSTSRYGYRILQSQGWKPGDYLRTPDASHLSHCGATSAGHIRVVLKDGNAGLGTGLGNRRTETYGLSGFQGLLGRLNGKTDGELNKEEETRRNVYLRMYTGQKYGFLNFVSGGFLVGDTISREKSKTGGQKSMWLDSIDEPSKLVSNSRKRKHEAEGGSAAVDIEKHAKRAKKRRGHVPDEEVKNHDQPVDNGGMTQKVKSPSEKAKARAERRALKDAKRARKEERRRKRTEKEVRKEERRQRRLRKQAHKDIKMTQEEELESDTPLSNIAPTQVASSKVPSHGRQALRKRYILQKKMASLDSRALKEIFMEKQ